MTLHVEAQPGDKIIELGGGANPRFHPNVDVRACFDAEGRPTVDFTADFHQPLPITSSEWDGVFSQFCLEHISYRSVPAFLKEVHRILRPGGKCIFLTANTEAQIDWLMKHLEGWDGKDLFHAASELLFGSQDMEQDANSHKCYFTPTILTTLFSQAGFIDIITQPGGERHTDIIVTASKPKEEEHLTNAELLKYAETHKPPQSWYEENHTGLFNQDITVVDTPPNALSEPIELDKEGALTLEPTPKKYVTQLPGGKIEVSEHQPRNQGDGEETPPPASREEMFDKHYFGGGGKWGGYAHEGYRDFPVHEVTFQHVMARKPQSVLEVGCARGYLGKRFEDAGLTYLGLEVSKHCYLTRACDSVVQHDLCQTPWTFVGSGGWDLCLSVATLEHVPEEALPGVIAEMVRTCKRGLHGIDFGEHDDGWDKTHCTLKPKTWWQAQFEKYAPGWPVEILDKEELERGSISTEVIRGDGRLKLNVGSYITCHHHGWTNVDVHDLREYAAQNHYGFLQCDVRNGLPFGTGTVDLIMMNHFLEHLTYHEARSFLKECRRVMRPEGVMRILVPDAGLLTSVYLGGEGKFGLLPDLGSLSDFDEINEGCDQAPTPAGKLWALLHEGHQACYDSETLYLMLEEAGFNPFHASFRKTLCGEQGAQILRETIDMVPCLSLVYEATPRLA